MTKRQRAAVSLGESAARPRARTEEYLARTERVIPGLSQTFSKTPTQLVHGVAQALIEDVEGSHRGDPATQLEDTPVEPVLRQR